MNSKIKILVLITARGGSKRLPGKNIKLFAGKPMLAWAIEAGKALGEAVDVLVSTDDQAIANVAISNGASVPWLRPKELSTDYATSVDVALHALDWYELNFEKVDALVLLQPTTPFRKISTLLKGLELFKKQKLSVVSVGPAYCNPYHCVTINEVLKIEPFVNNSPISQRTQDLPKAYSYNGSMYIISPDELRETKSFVSSNTQALIMEDFIENIDIDTLEDWEIATALYKHFLEGRSCLLR